jgi:hypothetical protein
MERNQGESIYELLQHDVYTPEEVSRLLGIDVNVVRTAAFEGELRAHIVEHDIISMRREDVLDWFQRDGDGRR